MRRHIAMSSDGPALISIVPTRELERRTRHAEPSAKRKRTGWTSDVIASSTPGYSRFLLFVGQTSRTRLHLNKQFCTSFRVL